MNEIEVAIQFAVMAHYGQEYGDLPYIVHPVLVARHFEDTERKIVALLHDIVEDTNVTINDVERNFGSDVALTVEFLTRRKDEQYESYIRRVSRHKMATEIKIADLEENIYSAKNLYSDYGSLLSRYEKALKFLKESQNR